MKHQTILLLVCVLVLTSCGAPTAEPTLPPVRVTETPQPTTLPPTATRQPTLTLTPVSTETPLPPTATPLPFLQPTSVYPVALAGTPIAFSDEAITADNTGQLVELARWGNGFIYDVQYSPSGDLIAVASSLGVYVYDAVSGAEVKFIETSSNPRAIAFSPDGRLMGVLAGSVAVLDTTNFNLLYSHHPGGYSITFSPDSTLIAVGFTEKVQVLDAVDGQLRYSLPTIEKLGSVYSVAFTPDG